MYGIIYNVVLPSSSRGQSVAMGIDFIVLWVSGDHPDQQLEGNLSKDIVIICLSTGVNAKVIEERVRHTQVYGTLFSRKNRLTCLNGD